MRRKYVFRLKLKEILMRRGITQRDLAIKSGVREATLSEMVNENRNTINKIHLGMVMDALNITELEDILELTIIYEEEK